MRHPKCWLGWCFSGLPPSFPYREPEHPPPGTMAASWQCHLPAEVSPLAWPFLAMPPRHPHRKMALKCHYQANLCHCAEIACYRTSPCKSSNTVLRQLGSLSWLKKQHVTSSPSSVYLWSTHSFCQSVKTAVCKEQQQHRSCCWHALLCKFWHIEIYMWGWFLLMRDEIGSL